MLRKLINVFVYLSLSLSLCACTKIQHQLCHLCLSLSISCFLNTNLCIQWTVNANYTTTMQRVNWTVLPLWLYRSFCGIRLSHSRHLRAQSNANCNLQPAKRNLHLHARHLTPLLNPVVHFNVELRKRPQSWASTPDIDEPDDVGRRPQAPASTSRATVAEDHNVAVTVKLPVPPRRHTTALDIKEVRYGYF